MINQLLDSVKVPEEPFKIKVFKDFCRDCFVYDSNPGSTIHQERDIPFMDDLYVTYVHYMVNENDLKIFINDLKRVDNDFPTHVPMPLGSNFDMNDVKTLKNAKFSPLILKLHELRKKEDSLKKVE